MIVLYITCWMIGVLFITEVENSCGWVKSTKHGNLMVVKEEIKDSKCLGGILLRSANESYCIAKDPDTEKQESLTCMGKQGSSNSSQTSYLKLPCCFSSELNDHSEQYLT